MIVNPHKYFKNALVWIENGSSYHVFYNNPLAFAIEFLMKSCKDVTEENLCRILSASGYAHYAKKRSKRIALVCELFSHKIIREISNE